MQSRCIQQAPELRVPWWIDGEGRSMAPLKLSDLGDGFKVIFCFQHWCPGCHSHGFPTLQKLIKALGDRGFAFAAVQTVFEGAESNTFERLRETQLRYGEHSVRTRPCDRTRVVAHGGLRDARHAVVLVIDPLDEVLYSDFELDERQLIGAFGASNDGLKAA